MRNALAILAIASALSSPATAQTRTTAIPVGRCVNIGNTFESPREAEWGGSPVTDEQIREIAAAGFQTIRLPVRWDTHAGASSPWTIEPAYLARVSHVVDTALAQGLNVILNSHHMAGIDDDPAGNATRLAGYWRQIAAHFANRPTAKLWFELSNEPHNAFTNANLMATLTPALAAVRATNRDRPVIIGGENWSGIDSLATLPLPDDAHIIPTFHYYEPFDFTHQGATWVNPAPPLGRTYGTAEDRARLDRDVAKIRTYVARTGLTPFMGETGAHTTVSLQQRVAYHRAIRSSFEPLGIGMCQWAFANTFPFYDANQRQWLPGMRDAIGLAEPGSTATPAAAAPAPATASRQPTPELQAFDDALPGTLVNDPSRLDISFYGAQESRPVRGADIPGGGGALRVTVRSVGATPYETGGSLPVRAAIRRGERYTVAFYARSERANLPDNQARVGIRLQENVAPYGGFGDQVVTIGPAWQLYEVSGVADRDIPAGGAVVGFQLGHAAQIVDIGQVIVVEGVASIRTTAPAAAAPVSPEALTIIEETPPQLIGRGPAVNDPTNRRWAAYGGVTATPVTTNVFGRVATRFDVPTAGAQPYAAGASLTIGRELIAGRTLLLGFLARTTAASAADGQGRITVRLQQATEPYDGFGDSQLTITGNWRLYQLRITAAQALPATAQIAFHLAAQQQSVEIGPVFLLDTGP